MKFVGEMIKLHIHGTVKRERYISMYAQKAIIHLQPKTQGNVTFDNGTNDATQ